MEDPPPRGDERKEVAVRIANNHQHFSASLSNGAFARYSPGPRCGVTYRWLDHLADSSSSRLRRDGDEQ